MPTINIPPLARFVLYLAAAIALLIVTYAVDKSWAGDAEVKLVTGLAALLNILAAAKTNLHENQPVTLEGTVVDTTTGRTGDVTATLDERGATRVELLLLVAGAIALLVVVFLVLGVSVRIT